MYIIYLSLLETNGRDDFIMVIYKYKPFYLSSSFLNSTFFYVIIQNNLKKDG